MPCGSGRPIATQIGAGITACQIVQTVNPDLGEAKLHLHRTRNYLVGPGDQNYNLTVGGMRYEPTKNGDDQGLGQGIIPDLQKVLAGGYPRSPLKSADAEVALKAAQNARSLAEKGLQQNDINNLKQAAMDVVTQLQSALNAVLA